MHRLPGAANSWWISPMPKRVGRGCAGMWWSHRGKAGGNTLALFIATCKLQLLFWVTFQMSHKAGGHAISFLLIGTAFPCLCQKGTRFTLWTHGFPLRPRKLEARPWSSFILITAISSRIKPDTPKGWDQTYLQLPKYPVRQYLCMHFQESIQPGPSQHWLEAFLAH